MQDLHTVSIEVNECHANIMLITESRTLLIKIQDLSCKYNGNNQSLWNGILCRALDGRVSKAYA